MSVLSEIDNKISNERNNNSYNKTNRSVINFCQKADFVLIFHLKVPNVYSKILFRVDELSHIAQEL